MSTNSIDAALLKKMFLAAAKNLEAKKEWINELNVFPVPDGDTGTNMTMTIVSAADAVAALEDPTMEELAKAISSGSLRGARGNSGVILSQLFRGFTRVITNYDKLDVTILAQAAQKAVETAYKAVMKPKEGTILTVAKGAAKIAGELVHDTLDVEEYLAAVIEEADAVLQKTPDMLPVLKEAGVVDSGGQGLLEVLRGAYDALLGKEVDYSLEGTPALGKVMKITPETEAEIKFGYCTEFIIVLNHPVTDERVNELKDFLENLGDSIVVVADDEIIKIHVHTNDPGVAITEALTLGSLSKIKIDNMREEHQEKLIKDSKAVAAKQAEENKKRHEASQAKERKEVGFISVSVGDGIKEIFEGLGADYVISGGQTMNPSTDDIMTAIEQVNADNIFVFPNNSNIILAANQAVELVEDKNIIVIPTKTVPQGIVALINYMPDQNPQENTEIMLEAISEVKSGSITYAVRDTTIDGKEIKQDDYMGIGDAGILSVGQDIYETAMEMIRQMVDEESGLVSIYYGEGIKQEDAESFMEKVEAEFEDCEVELQYGGQPIYYYLISVE